MAFNIVKFIKGILISESETLTPKEIEIIPGGTSDTKTTITSSQTVDQTITIPDATDTLVGKNTTDLLTNKSLQDTTTAIVDNLDPTKQIKFDAEGAMMTTTLIVSAPTVDRTLMLPDATDTLVGRDTTDTLTNKTLTAPVINTADINMGTIDGATINSSPIGQTTPAAGSFTTLSGNSIDVAGDPVVTLAATQTLTNKTLTAPNINNPVVSGGSINDTQIGNLVPDTGAFTSLNATTLDTTGDVIIGGNLTVNGTTTTLNTQTLDVEDANITVNVNGNDVSAEGAGLTVNRTGVDGSIIYKDLSPSKFAVGPLGSEDNVVTQSITQSLTNKSLVDTSTSFIDSVDATKQIKFDAAGATATSTTLLSSQTTDRILTIPDATDTLVGKNTTDILSNKTLNFLRQSVLTDTTTTGALATIPTPVNGVVRLTNASLTTISGIAAGLSGQSVIIENVTGNSIDVLNDDAGAAVGARIYTGTENAVSLSNNATFIFTYDSTNQHWMLTGGSGSGSASSGGVNFIPNGDAEQTANPFLLYISSGGLARPTGTQSPYAGNLTATRTLVNPLAQDASWLITKGASINITGPNLAIPFIVDPAYKAKSVKIKFDYKIVSGTFQPGSNIGTVQDSSLIVYIYDADTNTYIEPSNFRLLSNSTTIADHFEAEFQTNATSTNYQLIYYVAVASALPFEILVDNIAVSPNEYVFGTPTSDTVSFVPTITNFGTVTNNIAYYSRIGDKIKVYGRFTAGTVLSAIGRIGLPNGMSINTDNYLLTSAYDLGRLHRATAITNSIPNVAYGPYVVTNDNITTNSVVIAITTNTANNTFVPANSNAFLNSGDTVSYEYEVAVAGLSSSVQTSDQTSTRVAATQLNGPAVATTANNPIIFQTVFSDTHGAYNNLTGKYTAPAPGYYRVGGYIDGTMALGNAIYVSVNNNITQGSNRPLIGNNYIANGPVNGNGVVLVKTGDTIDVRPTANLGALNNGSTLSIERISGPSVITTTEVVAASYSNSANKSASTVLAIDFNVKEVDTHNAVTTGASWRFTSPVSGIYSVSIVAGISAAGTAVRVYKNGVFYKLIAYQPTAGYASGTTIVPLLSGDYIELRPSASITVSGGALASDTASNISINKINGVN